MASRTGARRSVPAGAGAASAIQRRPLDQLHGHPPALGLGLDGGLGHGRGGIAVPGAGPDHLAVEQDRKSTRLNSSHTVISYAVFCLKKKKNTVDEVIMAQTKTKNQ